MLNYTDLGSPATLVDVPPPVLPRHVRQGLCRRHLVVVQRTRRLAAQIERTKLPGALAQREGEHRSQPSVDRSGPEDLEPFIIVLEITDGNGFPGSVRSQARTFTSPRSVCSCT